MLVELVSVPKHCQSESNTQLWRHESVVCALHSAVCELSSHQHASSAAGNSRAHRGQPSSSAFSSSQGTLRHAHGWLLGAGGIVVDLCLCVHAVKYVAALVLHHRMILGFVCSGCSGHVRTDSFHQC